MWEGLAWKSLAADLYGWKVARAEALADRLREMLLAAPPRAAALRDEFAMRAPKKVPSWFKHTPPPGHPGPAPRLEMPYHLDEESDEFKALSWGDQCSRRDDHSKAYNAAYLEHEPKYEAWRQSLDKWELADKAARYFQWRWFYADQMLAARNPEPQPAIVEEEKS